MFENSNLIKSLKDIYFLFKNVFKNPNLIIFIEFDAYFKLLDVIELFLFKVSPIRSAGLSGGSG